MKRVTRFLRRGFFDRRVIAFSATMGATALLATGCAEQAGSGAFVTVPLVSISCTTSHCKSGLPARAFIVYTTSSCANASFGETVAGSTTLSCNGLGCSGTIASFTGTTGSSTTTIKEGFYSVCVVLDFNSDYIGTAISGDSTGGLTNTNITTGTSTQNVTSFVDL